MKFPRKLLVSIANDDYEEFLNFLENGKLTLNDRDDYGRTALHWAAQEDALEIVKRIILLDSGILDVQDLDGQTSLRIAAGEGHVRVVRSLIEAGAKTDVEGDFRASSALQIAVLYEREEVVDILIRAGADLESIDKNGMSARSYAIEADSAKIKLLLSGGDPS